jgi:peptide/nickel transport system substrate-binding protein
MRHRAAVLAFLLVTLFLSSCKKETPPVPVQRPLLILIDSEPATLDPQIPFEVGSSYVLGQIFDSLVEFDSTFQLSPCIAKRWTNPDDRTWRFYLNEQARFSNGNYLKASDVRFSIDRLKSLPNSDLKGFVEHIQSTQIVNDHTIDIQTDTPQNILNSLVFIPILCEKAVTQTQNKIDEAPVGSGPYKLERWDKGKKIVLGLNQYYTPTPAVHQIQFVISGQPERALNDVLQLKPDIAVTLPFRRIEEFQKRKPAELEVISSKGISVEFLVFNLKPSIPGFEKNPLADLRVRKAMALSIDRNDVIQNILKGFARPATQLVAPEIFGYNPAVQTPPENLVEAKRLLTEAGFPNLQLPLYTTEGGTFRLEKLLTQQLARAGIRLTLKTWKDAEEQSKAVNDGNFVLWRTGYVCTSGDAGELLTWCFHTRDEKGSLGKGNYANFSDPEIDRLAEENLRVLDPRTRLDMLQRAMQKVSEEIPYLPLWIYDDVYIISNRINWNPPVSGELKVKDITYKTP